MLHVAAPRPLSRYPPVTKLGAVSSPPSSTWQLDAMASNSRAVEGSLEEFGAVVGREERRQRDGLSMAAHAQSCEVQLEWDQWRDLIPGLPDEIAFLCLVRVPRVAHPSCRQVCKKWQMAFSGSELYDERVKHGCTEVWLYVRTVSRGSSQQWWQALDIRSGAWQAVPSIPDSPGRLLGVGSATLDGCLYVVGGMTTDFEKPIGQVHRYNPRRGIWEKMAPLRTARGNAAVKAVNGALFVAGGNGNRLCELRSVEVCRPLLPDGSQPCNLREGTAGQDMCVSEETAHSEEWRFVAPLASDMARYDSAVLNGRLYVTEGWHWPFHFSPRGFVYDPVNDHWDVMPLGMSEGWTGPSCTIGSFLLIAAHQNACVYRLEVYDAKADTWHGLTGPPVPSEISQTFVVVAVSNDVYVVGDGLVAAVGHVTNLSSRGGAVTWSILQRPDNISDRYIDSGCLLRL